jgi:hypothetical protein
MNAQLPRWVDLGLIPLLNLIVAFLVAGLVVLMVGENPIDAVGIIIEGALGWGEGIGFTLFYATNFIFTGLAVAVAFHAGLFNIGGEGQAYVGGLGVAVVCLSLDAYLPWRRRVRGGLGVHSGLSAGDARQPHRDHNDHVQFSGVQPDGVSAGQRGEGRGRHGPGIAHLCGGRTPAQA